MKRRYARRAEITRAIEAAKACGIEVSGIEVSPDGSIKVLSGAAAAASQSEFDQWEQAGRL